ncbi:MAG: UvrB/UvrC motif-containing protein, partial [ANME-2 cluster archaeon]|nr:UvrB/UvrC motif-containing protein [ANME-2 cluster archaeon]
LDADKEGFLRSERSLIQTIGRASRNVDGRVVMYADTITGSIKRAIDETNRRRLIQQEYNRQHNITPRSITKSIRKDIVPKYEEIGTQLFDDLSQEEILDLMIDLEARMQKAAKQLEFEDAASLRDRIRELKLKLEDLD